MQITINKHEPIFSAHIRIRVGRLWRAPCRRTNRGHIFVSNSHDTPQYAVAAVTRWWKVEGNPRYPDSNRLPILADNGGSNGSRCRAWKHELHNRLCNQHDLEVTVCHYPSGASKWNPIEHLLFSHVSKNWAGVPLEDLETMLNFIRTTKTQKGLRVRASQIKGHYPSGIRVTASAMANVNIIAHNVLPAWNYTIAPGTPKM